MSEPINAGLIANVKRVLDKLSEIFVKLADELVDRGVDVSNIEQSEDGSMEWTLRTGSDDVFYMKVVPVEGKKDVYNLYFRSKKGKTKEYKNVPADKINSKVTDVADAWFESPVEEKVKSSKQLQVSLKRVTASTGDEIHLTAINANYDASQVLQDLDAILSDDAFLNEISDTPSAFNIIDEGDDFDVTPCESCDIDLYAAFTTMMAAEYSFMLNCQCMSWNAKGDNYSMLRSMLQDILWKTQYQFDNIAELTTEYTGSAPHPLQIIDNNNIIDSAQGFTYESAIPYIQSGINFVLNALELYYCNFDHDIQKLLDDWIRDWKHMLNYTLKQKTRS